MGWNLTDIFWNMRQNTDLGEKQHVESDLETCLISLVLPVIQMTVRMLGALWFGFVDYNHLAAHMNSVIFWGFISTTSFHSIQLIVDIVPIPAMLPTTTFEPWPWLSVEEKGPIRFTPTAPRESWKFQPHVSRLKYVVLQTQGQPSWIPVNHSQVEQIQRLSPVLHCDNEFITSGNMSMENPSFWIYIYIHTYTFIIVYIYIYTDDFPRYNGN